jgi:hypothetical protein
MFVYIIRPSTLVILQNLLQNRIFRLRHRDFLLHFHFSRTHLPLHLNSISTTSDGTHSSTLSPSLPTNPPVPRRPHQCVPSLRHGVGPASPPPTLQHSRGGRPPGQRRSRGRGSPSASSPLASPPPPPLRLPSPLCSGSRRLHRASSLLLDAPFSPRLPLGSRGPVAEVSCTGLGVAKQRRRSHASGRTRAPLVLLARRWKAQGWLRRAPPCGAAGRLLRSSPVEQGVTRRSRATTTDLTRRRATTDERACATRLWWLGRPPCD